MQSKSSFKSLKEDERETRQTIILDSAVKLFNEQAFHQVGMRDIAAEAGISAATIYRYFPSRDDIIVEALLQDIKAIEKRLDQVLGNDDISIEDLAIAVVDYLMDNKATFQMMCHFLTSGTVESDAFKKFNIIQEYFLNMFNMKLKNRGRLASDIFLPKPFLPLSLVWF